MKSQSIKWGLAGLAIATASLGAAAQAATSDEAQIRALEDRLVAANAAKDVDAVMSLYAPDENVIIFDIVPPRAFVGVTAWRANVKAFFAGVDGPMTLKVSDLNIVTSGDIAYSRSIQQFLGKSTSGDPIDLTTRVTDVYRKIKGKWLIVHEHVSVPVDLTTGKPDLASKP